MKIKPLKKSNFKGHYPFFTVRVPKFIFKNAQKTAFLAQFPAKMVHFAQSALGHFLKTASQLLDNQYWPTLVFWTTFRPTASIWLDETASKINNQQVLIIR